MLLPLLLLYPLTQSNHLTLTQKHQSDVELARLNFPTVHDIADTLSDVNIPSSSYTKHQGRGADAPHRHHRSKMASRPQPHAIKSMNAVADLGSFVLASRAQDIQQQFWLMLGCGVGGLKFGVCSTRFPQVSRLLFRGLWFRACRTQCRGLHNSNGMWWHTLAYSCRDKSVRMPVFII